MSTVSSAVDDDRLYLNLKKFWSGDELSIISFLVDSFDYFQYPLT